ncbi:hypothetical protein OKA05_07160 [Luteolibacter arcticus]|uniref:Uncharacterized protein n=1 Tax=Luteolibacter arcticus TaxID=1581411 RepID=A0ABT3GFE3_9BACT|nr:hypothetical protein [Luteolibacter arcticus]MCW1922327.1 hypothetical protein [Luteolibacter arcticus]
MITLQDCIAILDQREDSPAYAQFKDLAQAANKLENFHGSRMQGFKKDGVNVHFEHVAPRVLVVSAVHLYAKKESRFTPYAGDVAPGVTLAAIRSALVAALGTPSSSGGDMAPWASSASRTASGSAGTTMTIRCASTTRPMAPPSTTPASSARAMFRRSRSGGPA